MPVTIPELERRIKVLRGELDLCLAALKAGKREADEAGASNKRRTDTSRIDFVYGLLSRRKKRGLTPSEIKELSATKGIVGGKSYPYLELHRLRKEGSAEKVGDKYFYVQSS